MKQREVMRVEAEQEQIWTLSADRKQVRLSLPDLPIAGLSTPVPAQNSETARKPRDYCAAAIPSSA
jgi:hypothetical protein